MFTKEYIASIVFQKITGSAVEYDLKSITLNPVKVFNAQYDMLLSAAMQKHSWRWTDIVDAIDDSALEKLDDDDIWQYKLPMPHYVDSLTGVFFDKKCNAALSYDFHDGFIYLNFPDKENPQGFLRYVASPCEAKMPAYFVNWLIWYLALNMVVDISGDIERLKIIEVMEKRALRVALAADNKAHGSQYIPTDTYIAIRR